MNKVDLRGGVRIFTECNAPMGGSLHIIAFSVCAVISRLAFAEFATRGISQVKLFHCVKNGAFSHHSWKTSFYLFIVYQNSLWS